MVRSRADYRAHRESFGINPVASAGDYVVASFNLLVGHNVINLKLAHTGAFYNALQTGVLQDHASAERLSAVVSGLTSLASGAATWHGLGGLNRVIVDMTDGYLLITSISPGSVLGVIAERSANLATVAYEMTLFANRAGSVLTPMLIIELKNAVQG